MYRITHLIRVNSVIERPCSLKIFNHSLPKSLRNLMKSEEVLKVTELGLILRSSSIHSLNDGSHVTKNHGMH